MIRKKKKEKSVLLAPHSKSIIHGSRASPRQTRRAIREQYPHGDIRDFQHPAPRAHREKQKVANVQQIREAPATRRPDGRARRLCVQRVPGPSDAPTNSAIATGYSGRRHVAAHVTHSKSRKATARYAPRSAAGPAPTPQHQSSSRQLGITTLKHSEHSTAGSTTRANGVRGGFPLPEDDRHRRDRSGSPTNSFSRDSRPSPCHVAAASNACPRPSASSITATSPAAKDAEEAPPAIEAEEAEEEATRCHCCQATTPPPRNTGQDRSWTATARPLRLRLQCIGVRGRGAAGVAGGVYRVVRYLIRAAQIYCTRVLYSTVVLLYEY